MQENDHADFTELMNQVAEACAGNEPPSPDKVDFYFEILKDLDFVTIRANAIEYLRRNKSQKGFFPPPAYLRDPRDQDEIEAEETAIANMAFDRVKYYLENYYFEGLGSSCMAAIEIQMRRKNETHLMPLLNQWGTEIMSAPTQVVRAQFVKSVKGQRLMSDPARMLVGRGSVTTLAEATKKLLTDVRG